jgi:nucleotide-binding universal stress UspA family protein
VSTILIGVDASERSEDAVAFGRRLATAGGARVLLACAFPYEDTARTANGMYREYLRADAQATVDRLSAGLDGVPPERARCPGSRRRARCTSWPRPRGRRS